MKPSAILDTPNFFYDPATRPFFAARRPHRKDTYRLEPDQTLVPGKLVVHNYGHSGAGITMSWGCALRVREILSHRDTSQGVAVVGAGIMGMTVATLLREMNSAGRRDDLHRKGHALHDVRHRWRSISAIARELR